MTKQTELGNAIRWLVFWTCVLFTLVTVLTVYVFLQTNQTHAALCTFHDDLQVRVADGEKFLRNHPEGFAGIPAAQIRISLNNQRRTLESLDDLSC